MSYLFVRTIHGRSRYPGLHIWGRNTGNRIAVKVRTSYAFFTASRPITRILGSTRSMPVSTGRNAARGTRFEYSEAEFCTSPQLWIAHYWGPDQAWLPGGCVVR